MKTLTKHQPLPVERKKVNNRGGGGIEYYLKGFICSVGFLSYKEVTLLIKGQIDVH